MELEGGFARALMKLADRISVESNGAYYPIELKKAVEDDGGVAVAKALINQPVSEGFLRLVELGRTDLSLESLILNTPEFQPLFTNVEIAICRDRIKTYE